MTPVVVSISIVSHGQGPLVRAVLTDLAALEHCAMEVILTLNIAEPDFVAATDLPFPVTVIRNARPRGFGSNHNRAFSISHGDAFCVMNPDVRLPSDPFAVLRQAIVEPRVGVAAPLILAPGGGVEDNARRFPSLASLGAKLAGIGKRDVALDAPDWVAGMFMLFRREVFESVGGFDERFFLYYEDVDLCARLRQKGYAVRLVRDVSVVHDAQRESHRNVRYLRWHLTSILRYVVRWPDLALGLPWLRQRR